MSDIEGVILTGSKGSASKPPLSRLLSPGNGAFAGFVAGLMLVSALIVADVPRRPEGTRIPVFFPTEGAAESFVQAWGKYRTGTWAIDTDFRRTLVNGGHFEARTSDAQRPADRFDESGGTTHAWLHGRQYVCAPAVTSNNVTSNNDSSNGTTCQDTGPAPDFATETAKEVELARQQVLGASRSYDVQALANGCFRLLTRPQPIPGEWGTDATFCFDAATGVLARSEIHHPEGVDVTTATSIRSTPTPEDFQLPNPVA